MEEKTSLGEQLRPSSCTNRVSKYSRYFLFSNCIIGSRRKEKKCLRDTWSASAGVVRK
jgi:hypothetical protein